MQFVAIIGLDGKTATGIEVPADVLAALGPAKRPKVSVTINDYTYLRHHRVTGRPVPDSGERRSAGQGGRFSR